MVFNYDKAVPHSNTNFEVDEVSKIKMFMKKLKYIQFWYCRLLYSNTIFTDGIFAGVNSFMNPLMMAGAMKGGQSEMMKMMALMSMMNSNKQQQNTETKSTTNSGTTTQNQGNPMINTMMRMGLCRNTETNESPFCTQSLCQLKGQMRYGNPNMYQCVIPFGCCYKNHASMMFGKIIN